MAEKTIRKKEHKEEKKKIENEEVLFASLTQAIETAAKKAREIKPMIDKEKIKKEQEKQLEKYKGLEIKKEDKTFQQRLEKARKEAEKLRKALDEAAEKGGLIKW
jgi:hypothetical protein